MKSINQNLSINKEKETTNNDTVFFLSTREDIDKKFELFCDKYRKTRMDKKVSLGKSDQQTEQTNKSPLKIQLK